ncbi:MAG: penicillin-binding protein, partial [Betaproteobacteria bacterium]
FIMTTIMSDVVRFGTATPAMQLKRQDLAGKTGTTNDQVDAWFTGFNPGLVAVSWIGFDQPRSLGGTETGAQAALPMWMGYMGRALKGVPEGETDVPEGVISIKINPQNGLRVPEGAEGIPEYFYREGAPPDQKGSGEGFFGGGGRSSEEVKDQLF